MKILTLNYEFPPIGGGAAPVTFQIAKRLAHRGCHVDVVTMRFGDLAKFEIMDDVGVYRTPAIRRRPNICHTHEMASYILCAWPKILHLVKQNHYDLIHAHFIIPTGPLARLIGAIKNIPYVITAHGSDVPGYNPDRFRLQHRMTGPLLRSLCRHAAAITSPSAYLKNLIQHNIGPFPVEHIPNGFDPADFPIKPGLPKKNIILSAGRLLKRKGFHTQIRAVHDVALPFEVHILGDGPCRDELHTLAEGSRTPITFHGWLEPRSPRWVELYQNAAIFTLMSSQENASVALLEAMAARCAVITSDRTGCIETVADSGITLPCDDVMALRNTLQQLAADRRLVESYAQKARQRLTDHFLWPAVIDQYLSLFQKTAKI